MRVLAKYRGARRPTFALSGARAPMFIAKPRPLLARPLQRRVGRQLVLTKNVLRHENITVTTTTTRTRGTIETTMWL